MAGRGRGKRIGDGGNATRQTGQTQTLPPSNLSQVKQAADETERSRHDSGVAALNSGMNSLTTSTTSAASDELCRVEVAPKQQPGDLGDAIVISSQSFLITQMHDDPMYRYEVEIVDVGADKKFKSKVVARGSKTDYLYGIRRELSYWIYSCLVARDTNVFGKFEELIYDRSRILFSRHQLKLDADQKTFSVSLAELLDYYKLVHSDTDESALRRTFDIRAGVSGYKMSVQMAEGTGMLRPKDLSNRTSLDVADRDRSIEQFYELATSQNVFFYENFVCYNGNNFYDRSSHRKGLKGGWAELGVGIHKNVRVVEGNGQPALIMQLDVKKSALFKAMPCIPHLLAVLGLPPAAVNGLRLTPKQIDYASSMIRDLAVEYSEPKEGGGGPSRTVEAIGYSDTSAQYQQFTYTPQEPESVPYKISIDNYYKLKYNYHLKYPNLPCVKVSTNKGPSFYPIELCYIQPNQRVGIHKPAKLSEEMIKECALDPCERYRQLAKLSEDAKVFMSEENAFLQALGIQLRKHELNVKARLLPQPDVLYANGPAQVQRDGGWRLTGNRFVKGARLDKWAIVFVGGYNILPLDTAKNFIDNYVRMASQLGMRNVTLPSKESCEDNSGSIELVMKRLVAQPHKYTFAMFLTNDNSSMHDCIKYHEQSSQSGVHGVLTQHVLVGTVHKSGRGPMTLQNLLMKTNMKLGGINHDMDYSRLNIENRGAWLAHDRMFMGLDVNHPAPMSKEMKRRGQVETQPSVIGFCSNAGCHPLHFVGEYEYCATRQEITQWADSNGLQKQATQALQAYLANNKKYPKEIWMYRDGVSEGQYQQVLDYEVAQLRAAIQHTLPKGSPAPKLVYTIVTKNHNTRLVKALKELVVLEQLHKRPCDKNIQSGTVVDAQIVSAKYNEFYLNSHKTIQGTARTPKYTVLLDEGNHSMNTLQTVAHKLCFAHGIVTSAVSIPAPCYAAHNLAKRGKQNFLAYQAHESTGTSGVSSGSGSDCYDQQTQMFNKDFLNDRLKYHGTALGMNSFWA